MKSRIILLLILNLTLAAIAYAAEPSATPSPQAASSPQGANSSSPEFQAIAQLDKDYEAAYNRADANAIAAFYTDDAQYVDEGGNVVNGRGDIEKLLAEKFITNPGAKLEIDVKSARLLSPNVLVEDGVATIAAPDGPQGGWHYAAVYLKGADNWKISQLTQTTAPLSSSDASSRLQDLAWMVGSWQDEANDSKSGELTAVPQ
jgi:uncharacterized protein (TIGR02246 family)